MATQRRRYDRRSSEYLVELETGCWLWQHAKTKAGYGQVTGGYAVDTQTGCWVWLHSTSFQGYGQAWYKGRLHRAHRLFYELHRGPIPQGLQVDHRCRNRRCVNPEHLEAVTARVNTRRAIRRVQ